MKNWIKNKLSKLILWAIDNEIKDIHNTSYNRFYTLQKEVNRTKKTINNVCNVGIDHHIRENKSWCVICTKSPSGKERVNFYHIHPDYVDSLNNVLKYFKRENVIIDAHPSIINAFKFN